MDGLDLGILLGAWNPPGNNSPGPRNLCADFDRDGQVNGNDLLILQRNLNALSTCASRFEGDADNDGDVDDDDHGIYLASLNSANPPECDTCMANQPMQAMGGGGGAGMFAGPAPDIAPPPSPENFENQQDFEQALAQWEAEQEFNGENANQNFDPLDIDFDGDVDLDDGWLWHARLTGE